jgi:hypothetical protein
MVYAFAYRLKKHDARLLATCEEIASRPSEATTQTSIVEPKATDQMEVEVTASNGDKPDTESSQPEAEKDGEGANEPSSAATDARIEGEVTPAAEPSLSAATTPITTSTVAVTENGAENEEPKKKPIFMLNRYTHRSLPVMPAWRSCV